MSASNQTPPLGGQPPAPYAPYGYGPMTPPAPLVIDPDKPPWGIVAGILTWVGSVVLLIVAALVLVMPYALSHAKGMTREQLTNFLKTDPTSLFLQIVSAIPAHLLTLFIVWAVVTHFGKRPFWKSLGWSWGKNFGFWKSAGLAVGLLALGFAVTQLIGGDPTQLDQIKESSLASRYTLAFLAAFSAPFVEELVYRGILYSALRKTIGLVWAVTIVTILFAFVHLFEYFNNVGVIIVISLLSLTLTLLRAYTGRLLPSFIVHMVFNGIQAVLIIGEPYFRHSAPQLERQAPAITMLCRTVRAFF